MDLNYDDGLWTISANGHVIVSGIPDRGIAESLAAKISEYMPEGFDWSQWQGDFWIADELAIEAIIKDAAKDYANISSTQPGD